MTEIKSLIQFLKADIDLLNKGIQNDHPLLLSNIKKDRQMLNIKNDCFIDLINKYCFQLLPSDYNYIKGYVPDDRMVLFKHIFLSGIKKSDIYSCTYTNGGVFIYSVERLYVNFFKETFSKSIITSQKIEDIILKFIKDWKSFLENQRIPVQIIIFLPEVFIETEFIELTNDIEIRSFQSVLVIEKPGYEFVKNFHVYGPLGSFLIFNTSITVNHNFITDQDKIKNINQIELREEWYTKLQHINEIFLSLNLAGITFKDESRSLLLPWWFGDQEINFEAPLSNIGKKTITNVCLKIIIEIFDRMKNLNIIYDKELELALYKYSLLLKRDFLYDLILDEFIILESLFTKGGRGEVAYRLSSNLSFFLAKDLEQFKEIYNCIKDFYGIRSDIAHGEDWSSSLSKEKIRKHIGIEDPNEEKSVIMKKVYLKLRDYIDKALLKIIDLKYKKVSKGENQKLLDAFKGTYFVENSFLKKS